MKRASIVALLACSLAIVAAVFAQEGGRTAPERSSSTDIQAVYKDIEQTYGFVPEFMKDFPREGIVGAWAEVKSLCLNPDTELSSKTKELISLGVASQVPCDYFVYFGRKAAIVAGANDEQVKEAIGNAALTRHWSTYLNGTGYDLATFKDETRRMNEHLAKERDVTKGPTGETTLPAAAPRIESADAAYRDIERSVGFVPGFLKSFPKDSVAGAWLEMKGLKSSDTGLTAKEKQLIGLAVAAQVPCTYCTYYHTEMAKARGATEGEINEAVAMAALSRHWSAVLNGLDLDERKFRGEVDRIIERQRSRLEERKAPK